VETLFEFIKSEDEVSHPSISIYIVRWISQMSWVSYCLSHLSCSVVTVTHFHSDE
jgi:hypothetical protein